MQREVAAWSNHLLFFQFAEFVFEAVQIDVALRMASFFWPFR